MDFNPDFNENEEISEDDSNEFTFEEKIVPEINTPEDAVMAYLREEIDEDEFRRFCGKFGVISGQLLKRGPERIDAGFARKIPDDIFNEVVAPEFDLEARQASVEAREKEQAEGLEAAIDAEKGSA